MSRLFVVVLTALFLAGCATTKPVVQTKVNTVLIAPPPSLYKSCPTAAKPPKADTLTNQQVVDYIQKLYTSLRACNISMQKIEQYIAETKKLHGIN